MYAIIDIETTGGSPVSEKITEIAVYIHDGTKLIDEFATLINPEQNIPYYITSLTGISNAMVADAPKFFEVARKIVELTQDCVFIAHNVSFDYQFVRSEFKRLGYDYNRNKLCTVQLSRKLIPGLPSYSLGKICNHLGIEITDRHRAAGDALATVKLFEHLLTVSKGNPISPIALPGLDKKDLHPNLPPDFLNKVPDETGVYYFYNDRGDIIYIGKSKNIYNRVLSHFRNYSTRKAIEMRNVVADVGWETTGSELIALLKESNEIKLHKPIYNRSQRRTAAAFGIYYYTDNNGYIQLIIDKNSSKTSIPLTSFSTLLSAKAFLQQVVEHYGLCQKLCGLYPNGGACFHYEIMECKGACMGKEPTESYNLRVQKLIDSYTFQHNHFFLLTHGKSDTEMGVVLIENGKYVGFGYIDKEFYQGEPENLHACIHVYDDNRDIQQIIRTYLRQQSDYKLVPVIITR